MSSKLVTDRQRTAAFVEAAVAMHGAAVARIVEEKLPAVVPGETLPSGGSGGSGEPGGPAPVGAGTGRPVVDELLQRLGASLRLAREELVAADEAHFRELDDDPEPRRRRDAVAARVYTEVAQVRTIARGVFGAAMAAELLGVDGKTSADPLLLHRQGARIVKRLADPETPFPESGIFGVDITPVAWADRLRPRVEELGAALGEVHRQRRAAETTLAAKREAQEDFDRTYQGVARTLEGVFGLAGLKDLANRVRPRRRKLFRGEIPQADGAVDALEAMARTVSAVPASSATGPDEPPPMKSDDS